MNDTFLHPILPWPGFSEPISCWTHLIAAAIFFILGFILLARGKGNALRTLSLSVYWFTLVYLFSMSAVYHLLEPGGTPRAVFQRLDHSAIWCLIAGTFTPTHTILFRGFWRWGLLSIIWALAITGLVLEVVFFRDFPEWLSLTFYLGLGWAGFLSCWKFITHYGRSQVHGLIYGGLSYSFGAILEFLRWPQPWPGVIGHHEIFHVFVFFGAFFHFRFIMSFADLGIKKKLTFLVKVRPGPEFYANAMGENIRVSAHSKDELYKKIRAQVQAKYRAYTRPDTVRLKYTEEEFLHATEEENFLVSGDLYYEAPSMKVAHSS